MDKGQLKQEYLKFRYGLERKVKSTFEYLAAEYGGLKSIALIFHDRDLTSDGERKKDCIVMILEFRNP